MSKRIARNFTDAVSTALEETEDWKSEINLRELIEETFPSIKKARAKKATWEQISAVLQKTLGDEIEVKSDTLRQYYFDAVSKREDLAEKRRQKKTETLAKKASLPDEAATITPGETATTAANQDALTKQTTAESLVSTDTSEDSKDSDSGSSFNSRRRKK